MASPKKVDRNVKLFDIVRRGVIIREVGNKSITINYHEFNTAYYHKDWSL